MGQQQQNSGETEPGNRRDVPSEPKRANGELGAAKKLGQIIPTKEPNENVPLAEIGVRKANACDEKSGDVQRNVHAHLTDFGVDRRRRVAAIHQGPCAPLASDLSEEEWVRIPAPELRIISDQLWTAAQSR